MLIACGIQVKEPIVIWCDNKAFIAIAKNPVLHGRTKHMNIKLHFVRDLVASKIIELKYCDTYSQQADILTKPLIIQKHELLRQKLGVCCLQSKGELLDCG